MPVRSGFRHDALNTPEGLRALASRDIAAVYRLLSEAGVPQRDIASLTGQSQSEVSAILNGRTVMAYEVMVKIAEGLDIPRGFMGLAYDEELPPFTTPGEEMDEEMKRRALLAVGSLALFDRPVLGDLLEIPRPPEVPTPLPSKLGLSDVRALDSLTAELRGWAQLWGGGAGTIGGIADRSERLLSVSATDMVRQRLQSTLAKLHTVAGWAAFDEFLDDLAREHFARAMSLGAASNDPYWIGFALYGGGRIVAESGYPNDALKYYQLAEVAVSEDSGRHGNPPMVRGLLHGESALELAALKHHSVQSELAALGDTEPNADSAHLAAQTYIRMGNLDIAQPFAVGAVQRWEGSPIRRHAVIADITLALVYVTAGDPRGLPLTHKALTSVSEIRSVRARTRLRNLVAALERRPASDYKELAVMARRVVGQKPL